MLKLFRLEWSKCRLGKYIGYAGICMVVLYIITILMAVLSIHEGEMMFENYHSFSSFINMLLRIVFQTFTAILLVRLIVTEYAEGTMNILFTYPVSRKKIMLVKMLTAGGISFICVFAASTLYAFMTYLLQSHINLYDGRVLLSEIIGGLPQNVMMALMTAGISYISLFFGLRGYSAPSAITSAIIIGILINGTVSASPDAVSLFEIFLIPLLLCLIGVFIGVMSWSKIDQKDI